MAIKIFITGGSFDKEYDEIEEKLLFKDTHIPEILKRARCTVELDTRTLMMVDSLDMTFADRAVIIENCKNSKEDKIIITHGTSTMAETAKALGQAKLEDKTIVLTGAMIPYKLGKSDAIFNIGNALGFVQTLPPGVYVAMNGKYFSWYNVKKNEKIGLFEEL
ncbi:MAG: asparaginase [Candidatus Magasanikbacteria bacterium]|nr:asparaginase [Candidatus Magasanikbacteria bacterium]